MSLTISTEDQKRICDFSVQVSRCELLKSELESIKVKWKVFTRLGILNIQMDLAAADDALKELEMVLDEDIPLPYPIYIHFDT